MRYLVNASYVRPGRDMLVQRNSYGQVTFRGMVVRTKTTGEVITMTCLNPGTYNVIDKKYYTTERVEIL